MSLLYDYQGQHDVSCMCVQRRVSAREVIHISRL